MILVRKTGRESKDNLHDWAGINQNRAAYFSGCTRFDSGFVFTTFSKTLLQDAGLLIYLDNADGTGLSTSVHVSDLREVCICKVIWMLFGAESRK